MDEPTSAELRVCAEFADGTRSGALVPLADFTRHRMAVALRGAATEIDRLRHLSTDQDNARSTGVTA